MGKSQLEAKHAVECGYWANYRYNPELKEQGKNPFILDSKEPTGNFREFLMGEVRYSALLKQFPDQNSRTRQKHCLKKQSMTPKNALQPTNALQARNKRFQ